MKRFTLVLLISIGLLPGLVCKAEDGSATEETDYKSLHRSGSVTTQRSANSASRRRPTQKDRSSREMKDWRVSYYAHAGSTPWWPGAPGE